ncbi:MAG: nucleotide exchange factor GrpE [Candidatus Sumerlaeaceae bacterium]
MNAETEPSHLERTDAADEATADVTAEGNASEQSAVDIQDMQDTGDPAAAATQKLLRLQADFDNFRRRNASAKQEARDEARRELLDSLLPIYDNFLRAIEHADIEEDYSPFLSGIHGIRQQFEDFFRRQGMEWIDAEPGALFDPNLHEATGALPGTPEQDHTIAKELQKGFSHKGQVVRPSKVLVYTGG